MGGMSVRLGPHALEDDFDPEGAAESFIQAEQVADAKNVILFGMGMGHRVRRLINLGVRRLVVFEPAEAVLRLAREHASDGLDQADVFTDINLLARHLSQHTDTEKNNVMLVPPAYRRAFPGLHDQVLTVMNEVVGTAQLHKNSVSIRSRLMIESVLQNLPLLAEIPGATRSPDAVKGKPAFIVSAGPSLDRNLELLERASQKGALFVVNTAAPAVMQTNAHIDAIMGIESLDVSGAIAAGAGRADVVALDLSAHPNNFQVPAARRLLFFPNQEVYNQVCAGTGLMALPYGASVATAAFSLAYNWGADPIVLLGQDLAYTGGNFYAKHTPHHGLTVQTHGDKLRIEGRPDWEQSFTQGGITAQPRDRPLLSIQGWGGGMVPSSHEFVLFKRWFEEAARQILPDRRLYNATEGGASIAGFEEKRLAEVLSGLPEGRPDFAGAIEVIEPCPRADVEALCKKVARGAQAILRGVRRYRQANSRGRRRAAREDLRKAGWKSPFVDAHSAPALIPIIKNRELSDMERETRTYQEIQKSAERVLELVS